PRWFGGGIGGGIGRGPAFPGGLPLQSPKAHPWVLRLGKAKDHRISYEVA
ncbi:hypothetical protein A2U01_0035823, partial [Trifolium medium]|nr:hypothetical protein [Trifolium medium]